MKQMKRLLIDTLSVLGYPVYLQGTINPEKAYPESFITFWTDYTADNAHYDNAVHSVDWNFTVIFYSSDPTLVNTAPIAILSAMKRAGFVPQGKGQDIPSDEPTHTGWEQEYIYTEFQ